MGTLNAYDRWINYSSVGKSHWKRLSIYWGMFVCSLFLIVAGGSFLDIVGNVSRATDFFVLVLLGGVGLGALSLLCAVVEFFYAVFALKQYREVKHP